MNRWTLRAATVQEGTRILQRDLHQLIGVIEVDRLHG
jgi:hypothetical protein